MYVYLLGECDDPTIGAFGLCFFSVPPPPLFLVIVTQCERYMSMCVSVCVCSFIKHISKPKYCAKLSVNMYELIQVKFST